MDFKGVVKQVPLTVAYHMAGVVKKRWTDDLQNDERIPALSPVTVARKGHDKKLLHHNVMLNRTQAEERADGEAAVTNDDERAPALFFGVPELNLPARDMFAAAIEDELDANGDRDVIEKMLASFEKEWGKQ